MFLQIPKPDVNEVHEATENAMNRLAENSERFWQMSWPERWDTILDWGISTGWMIIQVILVLIVGKWLIKMIDRLVARVFARRQIDTSVDTFVRSMLRIIGWLIVIMLVVSMVGMKTTSIAALLAAVGFAIGMALSGTLQNFAGGIMILLLKPFRTGDYIQAQGYEGTVKEIKLFSTIIRTSDNKTIIMPNGGLSTNIINNFSASGTRRVEWTFGITYGDDYNKARDLIEELVRADKRILDSPPHLIALKALDESAVTVVVRAWTESGDYWDVYFDMNEKVYKMFPMRGLAVPYNKLDVNVSMVTDKDKMPAVNTTDSEEEITGSTNVTKESDNSVASAGDSHEKLEAGAHHAKSGTTLSEDGYDNDDNPA